MNEQTKKADGETAKVERIKAILARTDWAAYGRARLQAALPEIEAYERASVRSLAGAEGKVLLHA